MVLPKSAISIQPHPILPIIAMICSTQTTPRVFRNGDQVPAYEPTPEQIRDACSEIQKDWTPAERRRRSNQRSERMIQRYVMTRRIVVDHSELVDVA